MKFTICGTPKCCSAAQYGTNPAAYENTYQFWGGKLNGPEVEIDLATFVPQKTRFNHISFTAKQADLYKQLKENPNVAILFETSLPVDTVEQEDLKSHYVLFTAK